MLHATKLVVGACVPTCNKQLTSGSEGANPPTLIFNLPAALLKPLPRANLLKFYAHTLTQITLFYRIKIPSLKTLINSATFGLAYWGRTLLLEVEIIKYLSLNTKIGALKVHDLLLFICIGKKHSCKRLSQHSQTFCSS